MRGFDEKPHGDGGWINGGFFVLSPRSPTTSTTTPPMGTRADGAARARGSALVLPARRVLARDGHAARPQPPRGALERGRARPGRIGTDPRVLAGAPGPGHGHTGFKGSWLSLWLDALGAAGAGFSPAPPTDPSLFELANIGEGIPTSGRGRARPRRPRARDSRSPPEIVIHMAAQPLVRRSYQIPSKRTRRTWAAPRTCWRRCGGERGAGRGHVTTDKVYENASDGRPTARTTGSAGATPTAPARPHGARLLGLSRVLLRNGLRHGARTARAGNVIGGGDWGEDRLVPDLVRAARGSPARVRHPDAVRPWQHVLNPLNGYLRLVEVLWDGPNWPARGTSGPTSVTCARCAPWPTASANSGTERCRSSTTPASTRTKPESCGWTPPGRARAGVGAPVGPGDGAARDRRLVRGIRARRGRARTRVAPDRGVHDRHGPVAARRAAHGC